MPETLQHHGRQMIPTPLNMELFEVKELLEGGSPVHVRLEPGDGTRYDLMFVPMAHPDLRMPGCDVNHFLVTRSIGGECHSCFVSMYSGMHQWLGLSPNANLWTAEFLNWWWSVLWAAK